jgi:UDP-N-acetylmuramyl pentapeptide phosphotransferase/UDP-N-acetylglucosamine-1-phosphate transferase
VSSLAIAGVVFGCVFGGAFLGTFLRAVLPEDHLSTDSKDVVKLGMGLIATMAALVLSLLIASAKSSFDTQRGELTQMSANVVLLDRVMAHYGPETKEARDLLRRAVVGTLERMWPPDTARPPQLVGPAGSEGVYDKIQHLSPRNDAQRSLQAQALALSIGLAATRWLLVEQNESTIPMPFLIVLVFWLAILFVSFGLFAPSNATVKIALLVCALSVSTAIYLILELDQPFEGLLRISSTPLRDALGRLGQ